MIGIALAAVAIGAGVVGNLMKGAAAKKAAKKQAAWANFQADQTLQLSSVEIGEFRRDAAFRRSRITGGFAAAGVRVDDGSADDLVHSQLATDVFSELRMAHSAQLQAAGFQLDASNARTAGKNAKTAGYIGALGSIAGGASQLNSLGAFSSFGSLNSGATTGSALTNLYGSK